MDNKYTFAYQVLVTASGPWRPSRAGIQSTEKGDQEAKEITATKWPSLWKRPFSLPGWNSFLFSSPYDGPLHSLDPWTKYTVPLILYYLISPSSEDKLRSGGNDIFLPSIHGQKRTCASGPASVGLLTASYVSTIDQTYFHLKWVGSYHFPEESILLTNFSVKIFS